MNKSFWHKCKDWLFRHPTFMVVSGCVAVVGFYVLYWNIFCKCRISGCDNQREFDSYYCEGHLCKEWKHYPRCKKLHIAGSVYCEDHAYCSYAGCGKMLNADENEYCTEHKMAIWAAQEEAEKRYKKEKESREAAEKAIEESKKNEIRRREQAAGKSSGSYNSYSDYDDIYDDVYDDVLGDIGDGDW